MKNFNKRHGVKKKYAWKDPYVWLLLDNGEKIQEHRYVMSRHLGRDLVPEEIVHHINGNTKDNRLSNLQLVDRATHKELHVEIGVETRFKRIHDLERHQDYITENFGRLKTKTIAEEIGCSTKTVLRYIKSLKPEMGDLRKYLVGGHPYPRKIGYE